MYLNLKIVVVIVATVFGAQTSLGQDHHAHEAQTDPSHDMHMDHGDHDQEPHDHESHDHQAAAESHSANDKAGAAYLTRTEEIEAALSNGGEPIVADVLGVVCDFCAVAMNKIFSKRDEVAAIYVDLDTKALSLVLVPGTSMSDQTIADLAVQAGYRIADVRRGTEALGNPS